MKDYCMWVEVAQRKRKCHRCGGEVAKEVMFVRMGDREKPLRARSICADCFEHMMNDLSRDFLDKRGAPVEVSPFPAPGPGAMAGLIGPRCFACGMPPERCQCGREAYR